MGARLVCEELAVSRDCVEVIASLLMLSGDDV